RQASKVVVNCFGSRLQPQDFKEKGKQLSESGPMHFSTVDLEQSALGRAFVEAGRLLGLRFRLTQSTVFRGQRWGTLEGYLRPVLGKRKNLHVLLVTHATKGKASFTRSSKIDSGICLRGAEIHTMFVDPRYIGTQT
ncbi:unnamed protein product, partial [Timema podura]|nr:unnamed protein product [Timema podura]